MNPNDTFILDVKAFELWENKFVGWNLSVIGNLWWRPYETWRWYSKMAVYKMWKILLNIVQKKKKPSYLFCSFVLVPLFSGEEVINCSNGVEKNIAKHCVHVQSLSPFWLFVTPWTVTCQAPFSMGFPRQEYWSGLPFPTPGDLLNLGGNPCHLPLLHW